MLLAGASGIAVLFAGSVFAEDWRPITPEEMAMKAPRVEKDADAEAVFWDVRTQDEMGSGYTRKTRVNYVRLKIFTEAGRQKYGTINIPYYNGTSVSGIAARTTKPDGTQLDLTKEAVFDRQVAKAGSLKAKNKSFAIPGIEPGVIIDYTWKETTDDSLPQYTEVPLQQDYPIETLTIHVKPLVSSYFPYRMNSLAFNCPQAKWEKERQDFYAVSYPDVPAYHEEPQMPPEHEAQRWLLIFYEPDNSLPPDRYWDAFGKHVYSETKLRMKINGDTKRLAEEITQGAATDADKVAKLLTYCQTKLRDVSSSQVTTEEREKVKDNVTTADTLKRGMGTEDEIIEAFVALATAAGLDARPARVSDRGDSFFRRSYLTEYFLRVPDAAVKVNGEWRIYDPTNQNIPPGMLRWQEEGQQVLVADPKEPVFVKSPVTPPDRSMHRRKATLVVDAAGTVAGEVQETLGGQLKLAWLQEYRTASQPEREEGWKDRVHLFAPDAEVTEIKFVLSEKGEEPLAVSYKISTQHYAQRTGKRLFLAPSFFESSREARFSSNTRRHPIYFHYAWAEEDHVEMQYPEGYEVDHGDAPGGFRFNPIGGYSAKIGVNQKAHTLIYDRTFIFGQQGDVMLFNVENYSALKKVFDQIHQSDTHIITFKAPGGTSALSGGQ
jgi:hypothetical protein